MPLPRDLQALSIQELRSLARTYQLPKVDGLSRSSLLYHLESIREYEAKSVDTLQELHKERGFTGTLKIRKRDLARLHHRYDVLFSLTHDELRRRAIEIDLPQAKQLAKTKLVVAYLEQELKSLAEKQVSGEAVEPVGPPKERPLPTSPPVSRFLASRWLGTLLKTSSAFFILLTSLSILLTPILLMRSIQPARTGLSGANKSLLGALTLIDGLSTALDDTIEAIDSSANSLQSVSQVLKASEPLIDSSSVLLGTALPDSIKATQEGLLQAEDSARALDQVLRGLAALGPLTGVRYDPDVPLHEGIAGTAEGLDPLPEALIDVRDKLVLSTADLDDLSRNLLATAADMRRLNTDIKGQEAQLGRIESSIENLSGILEQAEQRLPALFWIVGLVVELLLVGFAATQVAVLTVGQSLVEKGEGQTDLKDR
jgi:hypothetical protein